MDEFAALGLVWLGYRGSPLANTMNARGGERGLCYGVRVAVLVLVAVLV